MVGNQAIDLNGYGYWKVGVTSESVSVSPDWRPRIEVKYSLGPWHIVKPKPTTRLAGRAWLRPPKRRGK